MTNDNTAIAQSCKAVTAEVVAVEILQDNFSTSADREEFTQAIKRHGVTFLYLANSPIPEPSPHELSVIDRLARLLSRFWPESLVIGGCHE
ncbi:MAG: hypothetical protein PHD48_09630 [Alphaproteobacteria bacterium]|nr:hypothetical protein [Alphaproteobacteria bacterium]